MMTQTELNQAKLELAAMKRKQTMAELSPEDRALMRRYPKCTLAAARVIDAAVERVEPLWKEAPATCSAQKKKERNFCDVL